MIAAVPQNAAAVPQRNARSGAGGRDGHTPCARAVAAEVAA